MITAKAPRRCLATFCPQAWVNDYAIDIDGRFEFDITAQVEAMGQVQARAIADHSDKADELYYDWLTANPGREAHRGPFTIECKRVIANYFRPRR